MPHSDPDLPLEGGGTHGSASAREEAVKTGHTELRFRIIILLLAVSVTIPLFIKKFKNGSSSSETVTPIFYSFSSNSTLVGILGDVKHPGIYSVTATTMTMSVIKMAEPSLTINKILPEGSGQLFVTNGKLYTISITTDGCAHITQKDVPVSQKIILQIPLDINTMNEAEFELIPGIGPVMSRNIVEHRHKNGGFMKVSDLMMVDGIGEIKYAKLEKYFNPLKRYGKITTRRGGE